MIPVNVITGFLGSGKTTLLKDILQNPAFHDSAVIVNEFGEVGLDHMLLVEVAEGVLLLDNGCICCTIRSDLQETIRDLQARAAAGAIPQFSRLIIETTGLADPTPIVSTISADPIIRNHFRVGNIICTLDGITGLSTLKQHEVAQKQLAIADRVLVTKADIADEDALSALEHDAVRLNPFAQMRRSFGTEFDASLLIEEDVHDPEQRTQEVGRWLSQAKRNETDNIAATHDGGHSHDHQHRDSFNSFVVEYDRPIDWVAFGVWLTALLHAHGEKILRVKGILNVRDSETPVVLHGVQHVVYPPMHLDGWPSHDRVSKVVFITKGISEDHVRQSLAIFMSLFEPDEHDITPSTGNG